MTLEDLGAVLFDMDGTLVDTEPVWQQGLVELAARHGAVLPPAVLARMLGTAMAETMDLFFAEIVESVAAIDVSRRGREAAAQWLDARVMEVLAEGVIWRPGARELLGAVRAAGLPTALVTATGRRVTEIILTSLGPENFDVVVTDDDVRHSKPDPEPYDRAAAALGVAPHRCVAIEDSVTGRTSAAAAGCAVLAISPGPVLEAADGRPEAGVTFVTGLDRVDLDLLRRLIPAVPVATAG